MNKEFYIEWYKKMILWRRFEDKCRSLYLKQKIRGFLHLYNGQEALPAGITRAMQLGKDRVITAYRCHVWPIALGLEPKYVMAELLGKDTGTSRGLGGSMHIFSKNKKFYGGHGIVGGQIPMGAGLAFGDKYFDRDNVTICLMGDGATRQGTLHETFNMAMNWKLPVVFICENNNYAMGTSVSRTSNHQDIWKLGLAYDMPSFEVDGMDPYAVYIATKNALEHARCGNGPTFLDIKTYRFRGHSMSDSEPYRDKDEVDFYKSKDPIITVKNKILDNNWLNLSDCDKIISNIKKEIDHCVEFAENSKFPNSEILYKYIYKEENYPFIN